jgi:hypothetical protein
VLGGLWKGGAGVLAGVVVVVQVVVRVWSHIRTLVRDAAKRK